MDSDSDVENPPILDKKKEKSRRPPNTAFRQQRLKAWQPILTPRTVLPLFFSAAAIFALFGGLLIWASQQVQELMMEYTNCATDAPINTFADIPNKGVEYSFTKKSEPSFQPQWSRNEDGTKCTLRFDIPTKMKGPVYVFYRLTNFYQNHRRYVLSYNEDQIEGNNVTADSLKSSDDCKPLIVNADGKPYYPCGLIANSMFNDTFQLGFKGSDNSADYSLTNKGISWPSDRERFQKTKYTASEVVPPPNWENQFPNGYTDDNLPDISTWEEFQNWMRTAGLPTFAKLALRNDDDDLGPGQYTFDIGTNFDTTKYNGKKYVLISTRTAIGGKNDFLGIAYCCVAGIAAILGIAFLAQHLIKPRRLGDHAYLSWNENE